MTGYLPLAKTWALRERGAVAVGLEAAGEADALGVVAAVAGTGPPGGARAATSLAG